jgi:hypothetical protein
MASRAQDRRPAGASLIVLLRRRATSRCLPHFAQPGAQEIAVRAMGARRGRLVRQFWLNVILALVARQRSSSPWGGNLRAMLMPTSTGRCPRHAS